MDTINLTDDGLIKINGIIIPNIIIKNGQVAIRFKRLSRKHRDAGQVDTMRLSGRDFVLGLACLVKNSYQVNNDLM